MKWGNLLRFSNPTGFALCDDCTAYKTAFEDEHDLWLQPRASTCFKSSRMHVCANNVLCFPRIEDALQKFEISKQYKDHLSAVATDRRLESFLQAPVNMCSVF